MLPLICRDAKKSLTIIVKLWFDPIYLIHAAVL